MEKLFQSQTENNWGKPSILWPWPETKCNVLLPTNLLCKRGRRGFLVATLEEGYRERDIRSIKIGCKLTQQKSCLSHGKYPFFAVPGNHYEPTLWRSAKYWGSCSFLDHTHCVSWKWKKSWFQNILFEQIVVCRVNKQETMDGPKYDIESIYSDIHSL